MEILYLGSFFPESQKKTILSNSIGVIQNAGDTFQKAVISGLIQHKRCDHIITSPMIGSYPQRYKRVLFKGCEFEYKGIQHCVSTKFVNISLYKIISRYHFVKREIELWMNKNEDEKYILVFSIDLSLLRALSEIKKIKKNIHICLIVTDLIEFMVAPKNILLKYVMMNFEKKTKKYLESVDSYVFLTRYMKDKLKIGNRPYIVVEGIYDNLSDNLQYEKENIKTILYSGTLAKIYGIIHLLDAFSKIKNENYHLWICGEGDARDVILKRSDSDSRIKYFGQLAREEVLILQKKATVLINPRFSDSEFTKYSFASKTMEYMASGTPVIMHPLKCLDEDYLNNIYIAYDESDEGLKNTIIEVCEKSKNELNTFGQNAAKFIVKNKNSYIQVGRILELIDNEK